MGNSSLTMSALGTVGIASGLRPRRTCHAQICIRGFSVTEKPPLIHIDNDDSLYCTFVLQSELHFSITIHATSLNCITRSAILLLQFDFCPYSDSNITDRYTGFMWHLIILYRHLAYHCSLAATMQLSRRFQIPVFETEQTAGMWNIKILIRLPFL
jgi:hypothetical protein